MQLLQQHSKIQDIGIKRIQSPGNHIIGRPSPKKSSCKCSIVIFMKTLCKAKTITYCNWMSLACCTKQQIAHRKVSVHNVMIFKIRLSLDTSLAQIHKDFEFMTPTFASNCRLFSFSAFTSMYFLGPQGCNK